MLKAELNFAPDEVENIYLMGIGGVAMGALAGALKKAGFKVYGSDNPLYPPMSTFLQEQGISYASGYSADNLRNRPDLVIVGNVIRRTNPEVEQTARLGLPYLSLPQALKHFFIKDNLSLVVAGTHGKTSTTALLASGLKQAGKQPGYLIGGLAGGGLGNFASGERGFFVTEGDEYDTAFFDKRPKFVHYGPHIGILTSCEFDHADIYPDFAALKASFELFTASVQKLLIAWGDSREVVERTQKCSARVEFYGFNPDNNWQITSVRPAPQGGMLVSFICPQGSARQFCTPLIGRHNALNALACVAALNAAGVELTQALKAQAQFAGVARRMQVKGVANNIMVVDDFAHHPTAVAETIAGVANYGLPGWKPGQGRLVAVFEPRSNTSRRRIFQRDYVEAFSKADMVFLREVARTEDLQPQELFSSSELAADISRIGLPAQAFNDTEDLLQALTDELKPGDLCLIMSNGAFDNLPDRLLKALA